MMVLLVIIIHAFLDCHVLQLTRWRHNKIEKMDPITFWEQGSAQSEFPNLFKQFLKFGSAQAPFVPSERVFSRMTEIVTKKRQRLHSDTVNFCVVLSMNEEFIPDITLTHYDTFPLNAMRAERYGVDVLVADSADDTEEDQGDA